MAPKTKEEELESISRRLEAWHARFCAGQEEPEGAGEDEDEDEEAVHPLLCTKSKIERRN
jgi:hypothetical protein